jgi:ABC-type branched-subunit amino acid transport system ATPase component
MAFVAKPRVLLIDELSLGLAPVIVGQLLPIVQRVADQGTAVILVEQSVNVALTVAERAYFMERGAIRFSGPTSELLDRKDLLRSVFLSGAAVSETPDASVTASRLHDDDADAAPILSVTEISVAFGGNRAVNGTTFTVRPHEIVGRRRQDHHLRPHQRLCPGGQRPHRAAGS